jgi:hypothetical protein
MKSLDRGRENDALKAGCNNSACHALYNLHAMTVQALFDKESDDLMLINSASSERDEVLSLLI